MILSRTIIGSLNSFWCDENITKKKKEKRIGRARVELVLCYGSKVRTLNTDLKRTINAVDYLRRSATERKRNAEEVRARMEAVETVLDGTEKKSPKWFDLSLIIPEITTREKKTRKKCLE